MLRQSMDQSKQAIDALLAEIKSLCKKLEEKDNWIADLEQQLYDAHEQAKLGKKKRFVRSSEQSKLLNNRDKDVRAEEKSDYDGSSNTQLQDNQEEDSHQEQQDTSPKEAAPRTSKTPNHADETITHKVDEYYELPTGARFMKRNGEIDLCYYTVFEYQPAKIIKHVYEVARVQLADGTFKPTMECPNIVGRCPFSARMFAEMLSWKYVYNLSVNKIRRRLASLGVFLSRSSLNRYLHMGIRTIREKLEELFRNEVKDTDYLMIDETCALIGMVKNEQKSFKKKYIWAFYAHLKKMVYYLYESGSRARKVVTDFLELSVVIFLQTAMWLIVFLTMPKNILKSSVVVVGLMPVVCLLKPWTAVVRLEPLSMMWRICSRLKLNVQRRNLMLRKGKRKGRTGRYR